MLSSLRRRLLPGLAKGGADHGALALAALLALPPLVSFGATPVPSFEAEWLAGALGLAAACCFGVLGRGGSLAVPVSALLPVGLAALVALQMKAGLVANRGSAWLFLAFLAWSLTLLCTGAAMRTSGAVDDNNGCTTDRCDAEGRCAYNGCESGRCCANACMSRCP